MLDLKVGFQIPGFIEPGILILAVLLCFLKGLCPTLIAAHIQAEMAHPLKFIRAFNLWKKT